MASNPVASKRQRRRPKPGPCYSLRRHFRSEPTCHRKSSNQSFSGRPKRAQQDDCRNQQYSIVALTNSAAGIVERYAFSAYGEPVFATGAGVVLTESAKDNRYTYTGREWDEGLGLYHFRARMYDVESGRFFGRDPIWSDLANKLQSQFVGGLLSDLTNRLSRLGVPESLKQSVLENVQMQVSKALQVGSNASAISINVKTLSNKYGFLDNRPLMQVDPKGEFPWLLCGLCNAPIIWPAWAPPIKGIRIIIPTAGMCRGGFLCRCTACVKTTAFVSNGGAGWAISPVGSTDTCP